MKKFFLKFIFILLTLIILLWGITTFCAENEMGVAIANLARTIDKQFGISEVRVAAVDGYKIYINAGKKQFVKVGAVYEIIAEGNPITDPVNKKKIGFLETHIVDIKITTVRDDLAIGELVDINQERRLKEIKVGQRAIEKTRKVSIAVIKFDYLNSGDKTTPRIAQEFMINELIKTGRFIVADSARTDKVALQLSATFAPGSAEFTKQAGKLLGVNYIMYGSLIDIPGFLEMQCRVHDVRTGTGIAAGNAQLTPVFIQPQTK